MTNEEIYDQEIAPKLLKLCQRCQGLGMSFIACVEYDASNQGIGRTEFEMPDEGTKLSAAQRLTHWAARSEGNIDRLLIAVMRHAEKNGHSSAYLRMLGCDNVKYTGNETASLAVVTK